MPASRRLRVTVSLGLAGVIAALGVACSAQPDEVADGQTVTAACAVLADAVDAAMAAFAEADAADPSITAAATADVRDHLEEVAATLDNARVEAVAADLRAGFDVLADATAAAAEGDISGATGLTDATDRIRTGVAEYHDLCSG
ncbi:hypothetical protein [Microbacterium oleivorans]|uniref:hypothetical protein n=1 Tax=Microbacterium oleivorans TaxID=273677 RepID=UPI00203FF3BB|nr:hypothetical protein [Microbacterium oleivorans]MCM3697523.1 hypothetical protein [Microbacterium oleivorans]